MIRIAALIGMFGVTGCGLVMPCDDEVVQHVPSPYGRGAAVVFVRDCGATTGYATRVGLVGHVDAEPRDRDVVFVADDGRGAAPAGPGGGPEVRVRWMDGNRLEIAHHPRARTFRAEPVHGRVHITYTALP